MLNGAFEELRAAGVPVSRACSYVGRSRATHSASTAANGWVHPTLGAVVGNRGEIVEQVSVDRRRSGSVTRPVAAGQR